MDLLPQTDPTADDFALAAVIDKLRAEFPQVSRVALGSIFLTCKWKLNSGENLAKAFDDARALLQQHAEEAS